MSFTFTGAITSLVPKHKYSLYLALIFGTVTDFGVAIALSYWLYMRRQEEMKEYAIHIIHLLP